MPFSKEGNDPVTFEDCEGIRLNQSLLMLLVSCDSWDKDYWIPRSLIHDDSEVYRPGTTGTLIIPRWIAEKKGMI